MTDDEYLDELLARAGAVVNRPMREQLLAKPLLHKAAVATTQQGRFVDIEEVADPDSYARTMAEYDANPWVPGTVIFDVGGQR